jgi:hypothetical protein
VTDLLEERHIGRELPKDKSDWYPF